MEAVPHAAATPSCQCCPAAHCHDRRRTKASTSRRNMPSGTLTTSSGDTCPLMYEHLLLQATPAHRRTNASIFSAAIRTARPRRYTHTRLTRTALNRSLFMRRPTYGPDASRFVVGRHTPTSDDEHPPQPPPWPHGGS
jgi:hypothetical protein